MITGFEETCDVLRLTQAFKTLFKLVELYYFFRAYHILIWVQNLWFNGYNTFCNSMHEVAVQFCMKIQKD